MNINFEVLFDHVVEPYKTEIFDLINFMKKKPTFNEFCKYNMSDESKKIVLEFINNILSKLKNK